MRLSIFLGCLAMILVSSPSYTQQPDTQPPPFQPLGNTVNPPETPVYDLDNLVYTIQIESPGDQATFQNSDQSITVSVLVNPPLKMNDKVVILVDNVELAESIGSYTVSLPWLARGEHTLQAKVIPEKGTIAMSEPITIYQHRVSKLIKPH